MFFTKADKERIDTALKTHQEQIGQLHKAISEISRSGFNMINLELRVGGIDKELQRLGNVVHKMSHPLAPYGYKKDGTPAKKRGRKT